MLIFSAPEGLRQKRIAQMLPTFRNLQDKQSFKTYLNLDQNRQKQDAEVKFVSNVIFNFQ